MKFSPLHLAARSRSLWLESPLPGADTRHFVKVNINLNQLSTEQYK